MHLLLLLPGVVGLTLVHEGAHALAVLAQGGTVTELAWLPSDGEWGHVRYEPGGAGFSDVAVSLAPYLLWLALTLGVTLVALGRERSHRVASTLFVWCFALPLGDVVNALLPYLAGSTNDLSHAFGPPGVTAIALGLAFFAGIAPWGYAVQRRLYRDQALEPAPYLLLLALTAAGGLVLLSGVV